MEKKIYTCTVLVLRKKPKSWRICESFSAPSEKDSTNDPTNDRCNASFVGELGVSPRQHTRNPGRRAFFFWSNNARGQETRTGPLEEKKSGKNTPYITNRVSILPKLKKPSSQADFFLPLMTLTLIDDTHAIFQNSPDYIRIHGHAYLVLCFFLHILPEERGGGGGNSNKKTWFFLLFSHRENRRNEKSLTWELWIALVFPVMAV